jgi:phage baseplate assembly protein W
MQNQRKIYDFSSVGELESEKRSVESVVSKLPIGISTPLRTGSSNTGTFEMHTDLAKQIKDNLRNMIATNHGERLVYQDFGANLKSLVFDLGSEQADTIAVRQISETVRKYMPFVELKTFEPVLLGSDGFGNSKTKVVIKYSVPNLYLNEQVVEVIFTYGG